MSSSTWNLKYQNLIPLPNSISALLAFRAVWRLHTLRKFFFFFNQDTSTLILLNKPVTQKNIRFQTWQHCMELKASAHGFTLLFSRIFRNSIPLNCIFDKTMIHTCLLNNISDRKNDHEQFNIFKWQNCHVRFLNYFNEHIMLKV